VIKHRGLASISQLISIPAFALLLAACAACGKMAPPRAPERIKLRTTELEAIQRGSAVLLSWPAPPLAKEKSSRSYVARVDIYRLTEARDQEPVLFADDYEAAAGVIAFMDRAGIEEQIKTFGRLQYTDQLSLAGAANKRLRYAVRYVNGSEQKALFSNTVALEPFASVAAPPRGLTKLADDQDLIKLEWTPPDANVDGARPPSIVGYNIYRRLARRVFARGDPLNSEPLTGTTFDDRKFQYGANYVYTVRALSQGLNGLIESADSEPFQIKPVDTYPPAAPGPVTIASANNVISLFWPSSSEPDVAGYNVYRAESEDAPDQDWVKLNPRLAAAVTFRDEQVISGRRYYYYVTAVDKFENESKRSKIVSETANP